MTSHRYFAGIDGGGTKTNVVIVDGAGTELVRHRGPTSNAAVVGHASAAATLRATVESALERLPFVDRLDDAWFGLSGSDQPEDHERLRPALVHLVDHIRMGNDAELALGGLPEACGVVIVAGTGSIAFGVNRAGQRARAGGWGHVFSDQGSGYGVARDLFRAVARDVDGLGPATTLTGRLMSHLDLPRPHMLIQWVYAPATTKADIAHVSSIVFDEAGAGDHVADEIVGAAAQELAEIGSVAGRRLGYVDHLPVALTGGLLLNQQVLRDQVIALLDSAWPSCETIVVADPALTAARSLASMSMGKRGARQ